MVMDAPPEEQTSIPPVTDKQGEIAQDLRNELPEGAARWQGTVGFENEMTGDGRIITANALRWPEDLAENPIPIRYVSEDVGAHDGARVVGYIDRLERLAPLENGSIPIWGEGVFDNNPEAVVAREAYRHVDEKYTNGVSMDLDDVVFETLTDPQNPAVETMQTNDARIRAVTIVAIPAFAGARIEIQKAQTQELAQGSAEPAPATSEMSAEENASIVVSTNSSRGMRAHAINKARLRKLASNPKHAAFAYQSTRVKDPEGEWVETPAAAIDIAANTTAPDDPFEQGLAILNEADMIELGSPEYLAKVREAVPLFENVEGDRSGDANKVLEILNAYLAVKWPEPVDPNEAPAAEAPEGDLDQKDVTIAEGGDAQKVQSTAARKAAFAFNPDQWRNPRNGKWIDMPNRILGRLESLFDSDEGSSHGSSGNRKALSKAKGFGESFTKNLNDGDVPAALSDIDEIKGALAEVELDDDSDDIFEAESLLEGVNNSLDDLKTIDWFSAAQGDDGGIGSFDDPDAGNEGSTPLGQDGYDWLIKNDTIGELGSPADSEYVEGVMRKRLAGAGFEPAEIDAAINRAKGIEVSDGGETDPGKNEVSPLDDELNPYEPNGNLDQPVDVGERSTPGQREYPQGSPSDTPTSDDPADWTDAQIRSALADPEGLSDDEIEELQSELSKRENAPAPDGLMDPVAGTIDNGRGDDDNSWWYDDEDGEPDFEDAEPAPTEDERDSALAAAGFGDVTDLEADGHARWELDEASGTWELIGIDDGELIASVEPGLGKPFVNVNEDAYGKYIEKSPKLLPPEEQGQQVAGGTIASPNSTDVAPSDGDSNYTQKALAAGAEMEEWLDTNAKRSSLDQKQRFEDYRQAMEDINEGMKDGSLTPGVALTALMMADENYGGMGTTDAFVDARRRLEDELMNGVTTDGPSESDIMRAANLLGLDPDEELKNAGFSVVKRWASELGAPLAQVRDVLGVLSIKEGSEEWAGLTSAAHAFAKMVRAGVGHKDSLSVYLRGLTERGAGSMFLSARKDQKLSIAEYNWVEDTGGLPKYIRKIADHLMKKGMTESHAIATAVQTVKRWARGGSAAKGQKGHVSADTVAKAVAALAEWEAKRAAARATSVQESKRQSLTAASSLRPGSSAPATSVAPRSNVTSMAGRRKVSGIAPIAPPKAWFEVPEPNGPTPIQIDDDGRVYGHIATYDQCHIASPAGEGVCIMAPRSRSGYAYFHTGSVKTAEGSVVPTGRLTMNGPHADPKLNMANAAAHYDNTTLAWADVRAIDGRHGIWVCGALRPDITASEVRTLRASPLSGDWRRTAGNLEMILALSVNGPGFPVVPRPSGLVASVGGYDLENEDHELLSLVAAGMLPPKQVLPLSDPESLSIEDLKYLRALATREREAQKASKLAEIKKTADKLAAKKNRATVEALAAKLRSKSMTASAESEKGSD